MIVSMIQNVGTVNAEEVVVTESEVQDQPVVSDEMLVSDAPITTEEVESTQDVVIQEDANELVEATDLPEATVLPETTEVTEMPEVTEEVPSEVPEGVPAQEEGVYVISELEHWDFMRENLSESYKMGCDMDFSGVDFAPIGTIEQPFEGTFDGNGYKITNISFGDTDADYVGLFGVIEDAVIENVSIEGIEVSGNDYVGTLVGFAQGSAKSIANCNISNATVTGKNYAGGLIGATDEKSLVSSVVIYNSTVAAKVTAAGDKVGGLVGYLKGGISNSSVVGTVTGYDYVGGLAGNSKGGTIENCYTEGTLTGNNYVGGLVGLLNGGAIEKSYNTQEVNGNIYVGGLVGESNGGTIENSFVLGTVQGKSYVGGMIGQCTTVTYLIDSFASVFTLSKDSNVGGLCSKEDNLIINSSYFDISVSELDAQATSSAGKTTEELRSASTYDTWNVYTIWTIEDGQTYPYIMDLPKPAGIYGPAPEAEQPGTGTQEDPYIITTKKQLKAIADDLSAFYQLGADINLGGIDWEPLGNATTPFTGGLDGAGYTISNFVVSKSAVNNVGFFGVVKEAVLKDIAFDYVTITGKNYVGVLTGIVQGTAWEISGITITNSSVIATSYAGGLVGSVAAASTNSISGCSFSGDVKATGTRAAGLVSNLYGNVQNCYTTGTVSGTTYIGGLVGYSYGEASISNCYSTADVTGTNYVAGLAAYKVKGTIENSFSAGTITGAKYIAGILGAAGGVTTITNCYTVPVIVASTTIRGGIVGSVSKITNVSSYYDGTVSQIVSTDTVNISKTTSAMLKQATYVDWDFNTVWGIQQGVGYPYLLNLNVPVIDMDDTQPEVREQGNGTEEDPYRIYTAEDLYNVNYELDAYYILMNNIDFEGISISPIGTTTVPFTGNFNGNGYKLSNFVISSSTTDYIGLFGVVSDAVITGVTIEDAYITGRNYVGALVGIVKGTERVITDCCVVGGSVTGTSYVGGLIGYATQVSTTSITSCYSDISVIGTTYVGGLVGYLYGGVSKSYVLGNVTGTNDVGGLIGYSYSASTIENSYSAATVTGTTRVGGLIGNQILANNVINCYVLGSVSGTGYVGGILGTSTNVVTITSSYVAGSVTAINATVGGLTGNAAKLAVVNSYYDGIAVGVKSSSVLQVSLVTSTMKKQSTYTDWDFESIWAIEEGVSYPYLVNLPKPEVVDRETSVFISEGGGTQEDPYIIYTAEQLLAVQYETSAYYQLAADIDLDGKEWSPAGNDTVPFTGGLDGNGYTISNFTISQGVVENIGFFGVISNAILNDITIKDVKVNGKNYVGALVGKAKGTGNSIQNCTVTNARVTGTSYIGGLIGYVVNAGAEPISRCTVDAEVVGSDKYVGILIGYLNGKVIYCATSGTVEATSYIGGIAGYSNAGTIEESYSIIKATDGTYVGGIVGFQAKGSITNCYALGTITGANQIGGLIGNVSGNSTVTNSYSSVEINTTGASVGGIAPYNKTLVVTNCFYNGEISGIVPATLHDYSYLTQSMFSESLYKDWDFETVWSIKDGNSYPMLRALSEQDTTVEDEAFVSFEGTGSEEDPYLITTEEQLNLVRYELNACYKLMEDINLEGQDWSSIGLNANAPFTGKFDGNGHSISNFIISESSSNNIGFFGVINNASITGLTIADTKVTGKTYVGTLVGYVLGTTWDISDCNVKDARVAATSYAGGLVGCIANVSTEPIANITVDAEVIVSGIRAGGIAGSMSGNITNSYVVGTVQGDDYVGGIVGYYVIGTLEKSYFSGAVTGDLYVGGLLGTKTSANGTVQNCYTLGTVTGTNNVGGVVGSIGAAISFINCYSASEIISTGANVYGIYGAKGKGVITNCYYNRTINPDVKVVEENARYTSALKRQANFVDWDFEDIWSIEEYRTYPYLEGMDVPEGIEGAAAEDLPEGSGTKEDPYIIKTKQHLISVQYNLAAYYEVVNDIDLEGMEWEPLGTTETPFTGHINGNGFTIRNFCIDNAELEYAGLFGVLENAEIINLSIDEVTIVGGNYVGALAGYVFGENAYIENCHVLSGTITGINYVGGLIGKFEGRSIVKCSTAVDIFATDYAGGIVGYINGTISMCYASGTIEGNLYIGGLVGYAVSIIIENSYTLGVVIGVDYVGGIIGYCEVSGEIQYCYAATQIISEGQFIGAIYGTLINIVVMNSYYDGIVSTIVPIYETDYSRLTSGLCNQLTYIDWNFTSIWTIDVDTSYPYLRGLPKPVNVSHIHVAGSPTGIGTKENPYIISTVEQLMNIKFELSAYYKLACDLDLTGIDWIPLGTELLPFTGHFDGCGYTITGLTINNVELDYVALFGVVRNAVIINVNITCVNIVGHAYVGGLIGLALGSETYIYNCSVIDGTIIGVDYVGGLIGKMEGNGIIESCKTILDIQASGYYLGGIVGYLIGTLTLSYSESIVTGYYYVGGLVGYAHTATIIYCYFASTVKGYYYVGGIVGGVYATTVKDCHVLGWVYGTCYVAGVIGISEYDSFIIHCYVASKITVLEVYVGGLISMEQYIVVKASYYDGLLAGFEKSLFVDTCKLSGSMKYSVTYKEWDFVNVWAIDEGETYPYLRKLPKPTLVIGEVTIGSPSGAGTKDKPYVITSIDELINIKYEQDAYFVLGCDIDLEGKEWKPIGTRQFPFEGHFFGNGYTISNFVINQSDNNDIGFFGVTKNAEILDLILANMKVSGSNYVGVLIGYADGDSTIINGCKVTDGTVSGKQYVGGLIGRFGNEDTDVDKTYITNCSSSVDVTSSGAYTGNVIGYLKGGIDSCFAEGSVVGTNYVGGVVGYHNQGTLSNCFSLMTIQGNSYVGGIVGYEYCGTVELCECIATVAGNYYVGGITGYSNTGIVTSCESLATVSGKSYVGGIVGYNNGSTVSICTQLADIDGDVLTLIKENNDTVLTELSNSYATVTGTTYVGGIIGYSYGGTALDCLSDGTVTGRVYVGGVMGYSVSAAIEGCENNSVVEGTRYTDNIVGYER